MGLSKRQASCPKSKVAYRMVCEDRVTGLQKRLSFRATSYPYGGGTLHHYRASFADFVSNTCHQQKSINPETVIRRAEALDLSEQERVGRLVDRLENMKRNCVSAGNLSGSADTSHSRYSCALCGEKFTVLGAGPAICKDCRKHICQKCGIEATMVSCGSQIGFAQNSQRPRLFLCRICSETREMWKKSGAWFFKGLPKYVLPDKKLERGRPRRTSRASSWAVVNNLRSLESLEPDSSSDEDAGRRLAMSRSLGTHEASSPTPTLAEEKNNRSSTPVFGPRGDAYSRQNSGNAGDYSNGLRSASATDVGQSQFSSTASVQPLPSPRGSGHGMQGRNSGQGFQSQFMNEHRQTSSDQLNSNQVHSFRYERLHRVEQQPGAHDVGSKSESQSTPLSRNGSGDPGREQRGSDQQSEPFRGSAANSTGTSCGGWIRDTGSLIAIRPRGTVPPVQSAACARPSSHGHPRSDRFVLQAKHPPNCDREPVPATQDKNCSQDPGSGVQRDGNILRHHGDRHEKWQSTSHIGTSRRPSGQGFPRRSQAAALSASTVSNDPLQCLSGESLPGGPRRGSLGRGSESKGSNSGNPELQHSPTRPLGQYFARCESAGNGQQRVL
ncbi:regulating synaptic membrane exocytosis protein 1 isoform X12 [Neodiprion fabricii]|uniref:regulating synaptic membrane exocytosis protein 1 isoform X12 n=1 Tax=Neodiprion fabricii TaxID=2872261 RepID=UPI001ED963FE|nr:regulating synaptic membrane exocytosis protein 1 isoform X12 [Neodiprion fabricii]